jgi:hypothetical protein
MAFKGPLKLKRPLRVHVRVCVCEGTSVREFLREGFKRLLKWPSGNCLLMAFPLKRPLNRLAF